MGQASAPAWPTRAALARAAAAGPMPAGRRMIQIRIEHLGEADLTLLAQDLDRARIAHGGGYEDVCDVLHELVAEICNERDDRAAVLEDLDADVEGMGEIVDLDEGR